MQRYKNPLGIPGDDPSALSPKDPPELPPIQCTEDALTGDGKRSPESHQNHPEALTPSTSHLEQPQASTWIPLSPGGGAGTGGAAAFGSPEGEKEDVPTWMRSWLFAVPWEGGRAPWSPQELETPNPGAGSSSPDLLDLYKAPEALGKEKAPRAGALPGEALVEIRGPLKVIWDVGWEFGPSGTPHLPLHQPWAHGGCARVDLLP